MCYITLVKVIQIITGEKYYYVEVVIFFCILRKKMWHVKKMFYSILPCSWGSTSLDKLAFITDNGMPPKNWNAGTDKKMKSLSIPVETTES